MQPRARAKATPAYPPRQQGYAPAVHRLRNARCLKQPHCSGSMLRPMGTRMAEVSAPTVAAKPMLHPFHVNESLEESSSQQSATSHQHCVLASVVCVFADASLLNNRPTAVRLPLDQLTWE